MGAHPMTVSFSKGAYKDCYEIFDQALENGKGMRISWPTKGKALYYVMRCNQARKLLRLHNLEAYSPGEAMHGATPYDELSFTVKEVAGKHYVYIQPIQLPSNVESL